MNRTHIAFFGRRNAGKSSLVNAVTGQSSSIVSDVKGTTTDPVYKPMELLPLGPVVIIDTPGFDDEGELGEMRIERVQQVLNKTDIAVLVLDGEFQNSPPLPAEEELLVLFKAKNIPCIITLNKIDKDNLPQSSRSSTEEEKEISLKLCETLCPPWLKENSEIIPVSAKTGFNIDLLKEKIASIALDSEHKQRLTTGLVQPDDLVILVIPIDKAAPKGRLILPQQQTIRDILDSGASALAVRDSELKKILNSIGKKPALVITDSQVFKEAAAVVPQEIPLTSFSILFARFKGFLNTAVKGAAALDNLSSQDKILICEGCTHHRQCDDIGTVKIPNLIKKYSSAQPHFEFVSGGDFPKELSIYKLIIHCGSCMLNEREMQYRRDLAGEQNIPFTNYGITLAHLSGILKRSIAVFST